MNLEYILNEIPNILNESFSQYIQGSFRVLCQGGQHLNHTVVMPIILIQKRTEKRSWSPLQVEKLKTEVSKRGHVQQRKTKEKIVAMKRTQDLERQVDHTNQLHNLPLRFLFLSFFKKNFILQCVFLFARLRSWSRSSNLETQTPFRPSSTLLPTLTNKMRRLLPAASTLYWSAEFSTWRRSWRATRRRPNAACGPWSNSSSGSR